MHLVKKKSVQVYISCSYRFELLEIEYLSFQILYVLTDIGQGNNSAGFARRSNQILMLCYEAAHYDRLESACGICKGGNSHMNPTALFLT